MIGDPTKLVIRTTFPRLAAAELAPFRERSTSFVVDAMNGRGGLHHTIKPLDPDSRVVGSALTARAGARDNLAALAALDLIQPGDVLVISTQGFEGTATLGDNMARIAQMRGARGVVTDGMVRDAAEIIALGLPVFCRGVTPNSAFPSGPGEVGLPLAMGEVTIEPGDHHYRRSRRRGRGATGPAGRGDGAPGAGRRQGSRDACAAGRGRDQFPA